MFAFVFNFVFFSGDCRLDCPQSVLFQKFACGRICGEAGDTLFQPRRAAILRICEEAWMSLFIRLILFKWTFFDWLYWKILDF